MRCYRAASLYLILSAASALRVGAKHHDGAVSVVRRAQTTTSERTEIEVEYEYQLEVQSVSNSGSTANVMNTIDSDILGTIQAILPNGGTDSSNQLPNVKFESINSEIFSACFTDSEQCSLVRSKILVSYEGFKPQYSVQQVTLNLVQEYLAAFNATRTAILITYQYPFIVSALAHFEISPVARAMDALEIEVLEDTFLEVFGAIVAAMEGDTLVLDVEFLYQDLFALIGKRRNLRNRLLQDDASANESTTNSDSVLPSRESPLPQRLLTDMILTGYCRECTDEEFGKVVTKTISANLVAYEIKLKENGLAVSTNYFGDVSNIEYQVPELPSKLPPIADESIFDFEPPEVKRKVPWFLFLGLGVGLCLLTTGSYIVYRENKEIEKADEEMSTSDSDFGDDLELEEVSGNEDEHEGQQPSGEMDGESEYVDDQAYEGGTYDELEEYQVETIAPTEDGKGSDYEVYVF